jgi:hypothetical protein
VQLQAIVALITQFLCWDAQLSVDLVDDRSGAPGALIIHARDFFLAAGFRIFFEDDDLRILSTQLDHRADFGMQFFYGERDGIHFLHEFGADQRCDPTTATAGNEDAKMVGRQLKFFLDALQEL